MSGYVQRNGFTGFTAVFHVTMPPMDTNSPEAHFAPLVFMLEGMIAVNRHHIQRALKRAAAGLGPPVPPLYQSGVVYREDEDGEENWADCLECLRVGHADCDRLVAWRAAELREAGIDCEPVVKWQHLTYEQARAIGYPEYGADGKPCVSREFGLWLVHCCVRFPDGSIEDPSKALGMGANFSNRA